MRVAGALVMIHLCPVLAVQCSNLVANEPHGRAFGHLLIVQAGVEGLASAMRGAVRFGYDGATMMGQK